VTQHVEHGAPVVPPSPRWSRRRKTLALLLLAAALAAIVLLLVRSTRTRQAAPVDTGLPQRVDDALEVSPAFRDQAGIGVVPAVRMPMTPLIKVVGTAAFDPTRTAAVGTRAPGVVSKVFHVEGDPVPKGALLAEIDSPELATVEADFQIARAKEKAAKLNEERERGLFDRGLTTAREYEEAVVALERERALVRAAKERVEALGGGGRHMGTSSLRAPLAGIVAERSISPGQSVDRSVIAFRVGDLDQLWVLLRVFEHALEHVRVGDTVDIRTLADPERSIPGEVAHVGAVIDPVTRTADVRVEVDNSARKLRAGQAVQATVRASGPARLALAVPASAVTYVDGAPIVFVAETPTRFVMRKVDIGIDSGNYVEIVRGVHEGENVVSQNVLALKSELYR